MLSLSIRLKFILKLILQSKSLQQYGQQVLLCFQCIISKSVISMYPFYLFSLSASLLYLQKKFLMKDILLALAQRVIELSYSKGMLCCLRKASSLSLWKEIHNLLSYYTLLTIALLSSFSMFSFLRIVSQYSSFKNVIKPLKSDICIFQKLMQSTGFCLWQGDFFQCFLLMAQSCLLNCFSICLKQFFYYVKVNLLCKCLRIIVSDKRVKYHYCTHLILNEFSTSQTSSAKLVQRKTVSLTILLKSMRKSMLQSSSSIQKVSFVLIG